MDYFISFEFLDLKNKELEQTNLNNSEFIRDWLNPMLADAGATERSSITDGDGYSCYLNLKLYDKDYLIGFLVGATKRNFNKQLRVMLHIKRERTFIDRICFKNVMDEQDPLLILLEKLMLKLENITNFETKKVGCFKMR